jgi:NTP pyrophosphatase (non-canonical NTP hydrolase)
VVFSNQLTPAEDERLAFVIEEMAEVLQVIGKIQRHGYESRDPTKADAPTNRVMLEKELGDVTTVIALLMASSDVSPARIRRRVPRKLAKLATYTHHNHEQIHALAKEHEQPT